MNATTVKEIRTLERHMVRGQQTASALRETAASGPRELAPHHFDKIAGGGVRVVWIMSNHAAEA
ncbi:MAG: hypothetical protein H6926_08560 [Chromatiales bacterium]|nr:hypothetical protein [Chromatiales bacterium]